jgi:DNA-binding MarR family transcriptional regulator
MAEAIDGLIWEMRRLSRALAVAADRALAPLQITASERALIEFLARESGPISVAALARKRSVSRQHIHQSLERLHNPEWIEKSPDPDDARSALLRLTPAGKALWKEIRRVDRTVLREVARQVEPFRANAAAETLRDIRRALGGTH